MQNSYLPYEDVYLYTRNYRNGHGDETPYDVNGVIHLMLAATDNLGQHWIDATFEQIAYSATPEQREILIKIGRFLETFIPVEKD